jgi:hypothetical protein
MTVISRRGSSFGTPATSGATWNSTGNALDGTFGTNQDTFTDFSVGVPPQTGYIQIRVDFSDIPVGAVINSTAVTIRERVSAPARFATIEYQPYENGLPIGTAGFCPSKTTVPHNHTTTFTVPRDRLVSSTFVIRVTVVKSSSTQTALFYLDYVDVSVDWVMPPLGGKPKVWMGSTWAEKPAKVWTGSAWVEKPVKHWTGTEWKLV